MSTVIDTPRGNHFDSTTPYFYDEESRQSILSMQKDIATSHGYPVMDGNDPSKTQFAINNKNRTYIGGIWTTVVENGITYMVGTDTNVNGGVKIAGPVNIIDAASVTISAGAVVDGLVIVGTGDDNKSMTAVTNGGTLRNSFIANVPGYTSKAGSITEGCTFMSVSTRVMLGKVDMSTFYYPPKGSTLNFSALTGGAYEQAILRQGLSSSISTGMGGNFNSYISAGTGVSGLFTTNQGATLGCFLVGSMIETTNGLVAVEDIKEGDQVITYHGDQQAIRSIIWTGYNHIQVKSYLPEDEAGYPVRVLQNAIAQGIPSKDLLVTPEHSIFIDCQFVPVRMLVNGSTISYDHSITEYTFYHIETEEHSVISADNVLTESYLDTGNRSYFISDNNIVSLVNKDKKWAVDAAAPLRTAREFVEPIYMRLVQRATELGFISSSSERLTTEDSGLHLLTSSGEVLYTHHQNEGSFIFKLPQDVTQVRLMSRTSCPSQFIGPYVDDRRNLGVLIGGVMLLEGNHTNLVTEHLTSTTLAGWDVQEEKTCRWTNGNALLNIRAEPSHSIGILIIKVLAAGPYLLGEEELQQQVA